ncbi:glycosyltransferase family 2 protein [Pseudomonas syringae]|nr:glycosyltransferase family 2 protein [Pseudomonas syringae]MBD8802857.1 glycosyltransferase family 2 protein [Pseudomonas syringae]MBD8813569.1 glycosyltransferase family 2 protein [Pseudomonas syringae]
MKAFYKDIIKNRISAPETAILIGVGTSNALEDARSLNCAKIIATEAHPTLAEKLSKKLRPLSQEKLLPLAITPETVEKAKLHVYNNMSFNSIRIMYKSDINLTNIQETEEIQVNSKSLSQIIDDADLRGINNLLFINSPGLSESLISSLTPSHLRMFSWIVIIDIEPTKSDDKPLSISYLDNHGFKNIHAENLLLYPFKEYIYRFDEFNRSNTMNSVQSGKSAQDERLIQSRELPQQAFDLYWQFQKTGLLSLAASACLANINIGNFFVASKLLNHLVKNNVSNELVSLIAKELDEKQKEYSENLAPEISVIIPYHNREKIIKKCLDSVLGQTLKNIEVIVVDDGSTDKGRDIVASMTDDRLVKINCDLASGNSGTPRNIALKVARGNYIAFVDSDDTIDTFYLEELLIEAKRSNAEVVLSKSFNKLFNDKDGKAKKIKINYIYNPDFITEKDRKYFFINSFVIWDKLYKRSFMEKHSIRLADSKIGADTLMVAKTYYYATSVSMCNNKSAYNYNAFSDGSVTQAFRSKGDIKEEDKPYAETFAWMKQANIANAYILIQWIRRLMSLSYCLSSSTVALSAESLAYLNVQLKEAPFKSAMTHLKKKNLNEQYQSIQRLLTMLGR